MWRYICSLYYTFSGWFFFSYVTYLSWRWRWRWRCEFESRSCRCVLDTTLCQWLSTGRWVSSGTHVSSTNKNDHHDTTEIFLKVALNTNQCITFNFIICSYMYVCIRWTANRYRINCELIVYFAFWIQDRIRVVLNVTNRLLFYVIH
jgi:hypothetical protein